jgi:TonB-dependent receptor
VLDVTAHKNKKVFMEDIPSAYLMATVRLGKLSVVPGVRFERTINIGKGWGRAAVPIPAGLPLAAQAALTESQYVRFVRRRSYDGFYPNLQARYSFTPNFILRSAFTDNIGRPNFGQLLPGDAINVTNGTITRNNPELEPFKSRNYDLSAEYYLGKSTGSVTVGVFRRAKSNYFTNVSTILPGGPDNGYDGMYEGYTVTTQENVPGSTRTEGFEFGYRQNLRFMPGLLRNLIATSSYTYLKVQPRPGVLRVTGIFPEVYSGSLAYVSHGLRVDVKYNLRKQWYTAVNNANGELTYNKDDGRWDLAVDYRFAQRSVAYFNWRNVTRSVADTYIGDRRLNYQTAGSLINVGVRIDL